MRQWSPHSNTNVKSIDQKSLLKVKAKSSFSTYFNVTFKALNLRNALPFYTVTRISINVHFSTHRPRVAISKYLFSSSFSELLVSDKSKTEK